MMKVSSGCTSVPKQHRTDQSLGPSSLFTRGGKSLATLLPFPQGSD